MQVAEAFAGFASRRGGGPAPGDEPQALARAARSATASASCRARSATSAPTARAQSGCGDGRGLRRLRLPQVPQRRLRAARLPVDVAAGPLRPGVPVRAAERAADGLLRPRQPRPRGPAQGHRSARSRRERLARCCARCRTGAVRLGLGYIKEVPRPELAGARAPSASGAGPSQTSASWPRARAPGAATLEQLAWSGACDCCSARTGAGVAGDRRCGSWGWRPRPSGSTERGAQPGSRHPAGAAAGAARRAPACARSGAGSG